MNHGVVETARCAVQRRNERGRTLYRPAVRDSARFARAGTSQRDVPTNRSTSVEIFHTFLDKGAMAISQ